MSIFNFEITILKLKIGIAHAGQTMVMRCCLLDSRTVYTAINLLTDASKHHYIGLTVHLCLKHSIDFVPFSFSSLVQFVAPKDDKTLLAMVAQGERDAHAWAQEVGLERKPAGPGNKGNAQVVNLERATDAATAPAAAAAVPAATVPAAPAATAAIAAPVAGAGRKLLRGH